MRYADPSLCPDCRAALPHGVATCPTCDLPVRHPLAVDLFATLTRADTLVHQLRALTGVAVAGDEPAPVGRPTPAGAPPPPTRPASLPPTLPPRTGPGVATVPKVLLGLGALCLLVAAVVFLAVSWSWLGLGGRTVVLVSLTVLAAAAALLLHRCGLRIAAESLSVVALGLLGLDLLGAEAAGWFGGLSTGAVVGVAGVATVLAATGLALPRLLGRPRLVAPQVVSGLGALLAWSGFTSATSHDLMAGHVLFAAAGAAAVLARQALPVQAWALTGAAAWAWTATTLLGLAVGTDEPTLAAVWTGTGAGWSLLVSAAALLVPAAALRHRAARELTVGLASASALVATAALAIPCVDGSAAALGLVALLVTAAWTLAHALLPRGIRTVALAPAAIGSLLLLGLTLLTGTVAAGRVVGTGWDRPFGVVVRGAEPITEPLLTVPSAVLPLVLAALVARPAGRDRAGWWTAGGVVAGLAAVATLAPYDVPLVAVVAALLAVAGAALVVALLADGGLRTGSGLAGTAVALGAVAAGLPSLAVLALASAGALVVAATAHLRGRSADLAAVGGLLLTPLAALLVWSAGRAAEVDAASLGVPALTVVGAWAILRPRLEVEVPAALVAPLAALPAVVAADDAGGALALHLTLAGCLVVATALLHPTRRGLARAGAGLLLLATWVRLGDLGVTAPEPYTLPLAAGLVAVGLLHLRRDPRASTTTALVPGLVLATVPSLLWVLDDPLSARALLLGAGCLTLTVGGAALRWTAPLTVGATVGAVLVLCEVGPYAGQVPQWLWIGLAGALLTTVGITWERRLLELRTAVGLLGRLR